METARQLGVYEKACRELEEIRGGLMAGEQAQVLIKQVLEGQVRAGCDLPVMPSAVSQFYIRQRWGSSGRVRWAGRERVRRSHCGG